MMNLKQTSNAAQAVPFQIQPQCLFAHLFRVTVRFRLECRVSLAAFALVSLAATGIVPRFDKGFTATMQTLVHANHFISSI